MVFDEPFEHIKLSFTGLDVFSYGLIMVHVSLLRKLLEANVLPVYRGRLGLKLCATVPGQVLSLF